MGKKRSLTREQLIIAYLKAAWVLKIRLMSSRRKLWSKEASLIHIENAVLQIRMCCECIASMCLLLAEFQMSNIPSGIKRKYEPGKVFKYLQQIDALNFPNITRIEKEASVGSQNQWKMTIEGHSQDDISHVKEIWDCSGRFLHERSPYDEHPLSTETGRIKLFEYLEDWKRHHQWLWNQFWCHAVKIDGELFCIDLKNTENISRPMFIAAEGLVGADVNPDFDPVALADFNEPIEWRANSSKPE